MRIYFRVGCPSRLRCLGIKSAFILVLCLGGVALAQQSPQKDGPVDKGIVIGQSGDWTVGGRQLNLTETVPANTIVQGPDGGKLLVWFIGRPLTSLSCNAKDCTMTVKPNPPVSTGSSTKLSARVHALFEEQPSRYITAASRGLEPELKEAVVPLSDSRIDISASLADFPSAAYWVRLEPIGAEAGKPMDPQPVSWISGKSALISSLNVKPGVYVLELTEQTGEPAGSEAWILLSDARGYRTALGAFRDTVSTVAMWPQEADSAIERAVLRASLESLAEEDGGTEKQ